MNVPLVLGDWGSSRLRLWRMVDGKVADRREGPGIAKTTDPSQALVETLGDWAPERIILGGMAGARNGLHEVAYVDCPATMGDWIAKSPLIALSNAELRIASGAACRNASGLPDVMRGEETQVFGAMTVDPALQTGQNLVVLPGTHSKWVQVETGVIAGFRTFMTGELFDLLGHSSLFATEASEGDEEDEGFLSGLGQSGSLSASLFAARTMQLQDGKSASWARGFVSGLLLGAELEEMAPDRAVTIIGENQLAGRYAEALARAGIESRNLDAEQCTISGLRLLDVD